MSISDTLVLLGSISTGYAGWRLAFALGAITASFVFFFALAYGARHVRRSSPIPKPGVCWTR